jgi:hypothetical protein
VPAVDSTAASCASLPNKQSNAKALYLMSDGDLAPLGYLEKANPHHAKFALMRQYLVSQVCVCCVVL